MSKYHATVIWTRKEHEKYTDNKYSRGHEWRFDGGAIIGASSSPHVVPLPYSVERNVDPEEAFVASLSSCHMLFFLSIAAKNRFVVDEYADAAIGIMEKNEDGKVAMTRVTLRPIIKFSGEKIPTESDLERMHHQSHEQCFIANSVKTVVKTEIAPNNAFESDV
jgi:organic hydroperoxide reductase OsmC/OhrA